jgi:hemerythrin-like domain-containing protein
MGAMEDAKATLAQLKDEHRQLAKLAERLKKGPPAKTASLLQQFADLLEAHIRKEERVLFPCYEGHIAPAEAERVGAEVRKIIGTGMEPKCSV